MSLVENTPTRFIGLDIHKEYFVASGVNPAQEPVFGPQRISNADLPAWASKHFTHQDAVKARARWNIPVRTLTGSSWGGS